MADVIVDAFEAAIPFEDQRAEAEAKGILAPPVPPEVFRQREAVARMNGTLKVPPAAFDADSFSLVSRQTPLRNQFDRGTCYAFAGTAALEAFLKARNGVELDLSEQYLFHMHKVTDLTPGVAAPPIETGTSTIGFQGGSGILDDLVRFALPLETDAPYLTQRELLAVRRSIPAAGAPTGPEGGSFSTQEELDAFEYSEAHVPVRARWSARHRVTDFDTLPDVTRRRLSERSGQAARS